MEKKGLYDCKTQIIKLICGFRFKSTIFLFDSTQTVAAWGVDFLFNYLLVYWSSFFFVAGWQAFGISLAWVEHIPALFQFWSDDILHCHLGGGKLKQPFFLWITKKEFFNKFNLISVSFYVTVCRLLTYRGHCMVAFGMFYFSLKAISFWEWKKKTRNWIDFALALWLVQKSHATKQSDAKLKLITT